jgi:L-alanine-DL-glutamate epimerase-like enolase superfamily enzyme
MLKAWRSPDRARSTASDRIEEVYPATCRFALDEPLDIGGHRISAREYTVARVTTEDGITGSAYAYTQGAPLEQVIREAFTDYLVGESWWDVDRLQEWAAGLETDFPREIVQRAYSLIDICLWDIRGKALGVPLWQLLGGYRQTIPLLLVEGYPRVDEDPETFAQRISDRVHQGFEAIKIAYSGVPSNATDRLRATRERVSSDVQLVVDGAWSWETVDEAASLADQWSPYDLAWLEDPFAASEVGMISALRDRCGSPIGAGDAMTSLETLGALLAADALDVVRLDITQLGGIGPFQAAMAFASLYGRPVSPHIYPEVHQHLAFARPGVSYVELFPDDSPFWRTGRFVRSDLDTRIERGQLTAPTQPGVGIEIDWTVVAAHAPPDR